MRCALFLFALCAFGQLAVQPDVRKASWGMTPDEVRALEPGHPIEERSAGTLSLRYPNPEFLKSGTLAYVFANGKLTRVLYIFASEHEDLNEFIADFQAIAKPLLAAHGQPVCDHVVWIDDSLQIERMPYLIQDRKLPSTLLPPDPQMGLALSLGHFQLYTAWDGSRTQILHTMIGSKGKDAEGRILHRIEFRHTTAFPDPTLTQVCQQ
jgi:hypothetical protein